MAIGVTEEHEELRRAVRRFVEARVGRTAVRSHLDAPADRLPEFWDALCAPGWLGLHVPEEYGGSGAGFVEQAVVLEELGRALAPGPYLPTAIAAALLAEAGGPAAGELLSGVVGGAPIAAVVLSPGGPVFGGAVVGTEGGVVVGAFGDAWAALDAGSLALREVASVDPTRRMATIDAPGATVPEGRVLAGLDATRGRAIAAVLLAAEAVGIAQWCVDTAADHAQARVQFGRPIGQFQGVKHRCADMLARTELARAAAWDAARALGEPGEPGSAIAVAAAAALACDAALRNAKDCIQTLGGTGFTWEHDAHVALRRALTLHQLVGTPGEWRVDAARAALAGTRRRLAVDLPAGTERVRAEIRALLDRIRELDHREQRVQLAETGYLVPAWPRPWGRGADAVELAVIDEELRAAQVRRPGIDIAGWALPSVIVYGTPEQQARWIPPTLRGELRWCQLFSEPEAGSDLASLQLRATRVEGGWRLDGQKVWTSLAREADWGICLARTDPARPKHEGISCFMVDMRSPGIEIRPLRELTGMEMFNEVFFDGVFVPEDCLVGAEHDGWRCARTTLANERVYMGGGNTVGGGVAGVLALVHERGLADDERVLDAAGDLVVTGHALAVLGFRLTLRALAGADPSGSEAAVRKLLGVHHDQQVQEVGLTLLGPDGTVDDGDARRWIFSFLFNRSLTIAGGTSDVQRNVIAERLLGLPRDPEPGA